MTGAKDIPVAASPELPKTTPLSKFASARKTVVWSPLPELHKPSVDSSPSRLTVQTPSRSILKTTAARVLDYSTNITASPTPNASQTPFVVMLESFTQALAGEDRVQKLDAYQTFSYTLRGYESIPDLPALIAKLPTLAKCIRRDITAQDENGNVDFQLTSYALKAVAFMLWHSEIANAFSPIDASFFITNSLNVLSGDKVSKQTANLHLWLLGSQKLPPNIITPVIADQIMTAALNIRIQSVSTAQERLAVLSRLLNQSPSVVSARANDFLIVIIGGMLDATSMVRAKALSCAIEVVKTLGRDKAVSRATASFMKRVAQDGRSMLEIVIQRCQEIMAEEKNGVFVAEAWGVILLLRGDAPKWDKINDYLKVIQPCFNHVGAATKIAAQSAWVKLIHAFGMDGLASSQRRIALICQPIKLVLSGRNGPQVKQAAVNTTCALLYAALRPNADAEQMTAVWDQIVNPLVCPEMLVHEQTCATACKILVSLLDPEPTKTWREDRLLEGEVDPAELPRFEPKWIRNNSRKVAEVVDKVLQTVKVAKPGDQWVPGPVDGQNIGVLTQSAMSVFIAFAKALGAAGRKEILVSAETMESVATLMWLLERVWTSDDYQSSVIPEGEQAIASNTRVQRFILLATASVQSLGTKTFTDKVLSFTEGAFPAPAPTPSMHPGATNNVGADSGSMTRSPFKHLVLFFLRPPVNMQPNEVSAAALRVLLDIISTAQGSPRKALTLLGSLLDLFDMSRDRREAECYAWIAITSAMDIILSREEPVKGTMSPSARVLDDSQNGVEYQSVMRVLEWAVHYGEPVCVDTWSRLCVVFRDQLTKEHNEMAAAAAITVPLTDALLHDSKLPNETLLEYAEVMLVHARFITPTAASMDVSGTGLLKALIKKNAPKVQESLVNLAAGVLSRHSSFADKVPSDTLLKRTAAFVHAFPREHAIAFLEALQPGIEHWVNGAAKDNMDLLNMLWGAVMEAISSAPAHDSQTLSRVSRFFQMGFRSANPLIKKVALETWVKTYDGQEGLQYPEDLVQTFKEVLENSSLQAPHDPSSTADNAAKEQIEEVVKEGNAEEIEEVVVKRVVVEHVVESQDEAMVDAPPVEDTLTTTSNELEQGVQPSVLQLLQQIDSSPAQPSSASKSALKRKRKRMAALAAVQEKQSGNDSVDDSATEQPRVVPVLKPRLDAEPMSDDFSEQNSPSRLRSKRRRTTDLRKQAASSAPQTSGSVSRASVDGDGSKTDRIPVDPAVPGTEIAERVPEDDTVADSILEQFQATITNMEENVQHLDQEGIYKLEGMLVSLQQKLWQRRRDFIG
ncbi:hypothetical protein SAICODRAFT_72794 [Saitoella complicata NRRL Y-17804]|nr:uncharacterized protein SAICODRAFT_72794 [Saitoella complicata NRRL Y-17804]ODQ51187.1 hypothetical protein SAICODRAFT_72794 [Saitoella complicata NRRL Y-17804]